jgi:hypothetical protein
VKTEKTRCSVFLIGLGYTDTCEKNLATRQLVTDLGYWASAHGFVAGICSALGQVDTATPVTVAGGSPQLAPRDRILV